MGPLIIAVFLGLACILIVVQPLLGLERESPSGEAETPATIAEVAERERLAKQALREVDLDYRLGNLDSGDYETLHDRYERRALAAIKTRYQREQELDSLIERQLATLRQQDARRNGAKTTRKATANNGATHTAATALTEREGGAITDTPNTTPDTTDTQEPATTHSATPAATARYAPSTSATTRRATAGNVHKSSVRDRRTRRKGV